MCGAGQLLVVAYGPLGAIRIPMSTLYVLFRRKHHKLLLIGIRVSSKSQPQLIVPHKAQMNGEFASYLIHTQSNFMTTTDIVNHPCYSNYCIHVCLKFVEDPALKTTIIECVLHIADTGK